MKACGFCHRCGAATLPALIPSGEYCIACGVYQRPAAHGWHEFAGEPVDASACPVAMVRGLGAGEPPLTAHRRRERRAYWRRVAEHIEAYEIAAGLLSPADVRARSSIFAWCERQERAEAEQRAAEGQATVGG